MSKTMNNVLSTCSSSRNELATKVKHHGEDNYFIYHWTWQEILDQASRRGSPQKTTSGVISQSENEVHHVMRRRGCAKTEIVLKSEQCGLVGDGCL